MPSSTILKPLYVEGYRTDLLDLDEALCKPRRRYSIAGGFSISILKIIDTRYIDIVFH